MQLSELKSIIDEVQTEYEDVQSPTDITAKLLEIREKRESTQFVIDLLQDRLLRQ
jgi:hypothetical protein